MPSDQDLIEDLNRVAEKVGRSPSYDDYDEHGKYSPRTVENHFGTWNEAKEAAGLQKIKRNDIPTDELLADLDRIANIVGAAPVIEDYKEKGKFAITTYHNRFGSWNEAVRAAGYTPQKLYNIPEEDLLKDLERVAKIVSSAPTQREYNKLGKYAHGTFSNHFEVWTNAHRRIGREPNKGGALPPEHPYSTRATNKELLDNLRELGNKNGSAPSKREVQEGEYSVSTYELRFGGLWAAGVRAGLTPSCPRPLPTEAFKNYHQAALELSPENTVIALLPAFTGLTPSVMAEFSKDWREKRSDKRIITVPREFTNTELSWMFRIPEVWINPDTGETLETHLPSLLDWYWNFYDRIHLGTDAIAQRVKKTAQEADLGNYREKIDVSYIKESVPDLSVEDLAMTHGVNLARRDIGAEDIARRLGIEYRGNRFSLRNIFVWCEEHHGHSPHNWRKEE